MSGAVLIWPMGMCEKLCVLLSLVLASYRDLNMTNNLQIDNGFPLIFHLTYMVW